MGSLGSVFKFFSCFKSNASLKMTMCCCLCFVGDGCGHTVFGPESGTFTSINYPYAYPNSTVCEWEIRVKPEQRVQLKFGDFDIDDSDSCHFNYVRIYNGIGPTRTEMGKKRFPISVSKHLRILV